MFRASQHPVSSGALKTVTATSGIGHNTGIMTVTATSGIGHNTGIMAHTRGSGYSFCAPDDGCCDAQNM